MEKSKRGPKPDLKSLITDFVKDQIYNLELEKKEEENELLNRISNYSAKQLEQLGVCIRKLKIEEITYSSYGKYLTEFKKKSENDFSNKISKYKFDNGDVVGLFSYGNKINDIPLYKGIVSQFNSKKILIAFDEEIDLSSLPNNLCLIQLVNQVTYDRIKNGLEKLKEMNFNEKCYPLLNTLFEINEEPTYDNSEEKLNIINNLNYFNNQLNESQKNAIKFALKVNEIGLIHGPPGTGKTTTIVEIILQLVKLGNKILVVAPSNIAVDNIGEKLIKYKNIFNKDKKDKNFKLDFDLVRIGHPARLLPSVINDCLDSKMENSQNAKFVKQVKREIDKKKKELNKLSYKEKEKKSELKSELKSLRNDIKGSYKKEVLNIYSKMNIILATCVGSGENYLNHEISENNPFDYIIIDECAQATECLCWISILQGKKLILAGDHLQLPPTIKSKEAEYILSYTLFDRLIKIYGDKCCRMLTIQYRMNEKIMKFSSDELYNGKLKADESVKNHNIEDLCKLRYNNDIIEEIKLNDLWDIFDKNLILINTSGLEFYETVDNETLSRFNLGEVEICKKLIDYLLNTIKVYNSDIGVITPYSAQVSFLNENIPFEKYENIEISTVDGFQGREKEIIILSLVRSNMKHQVGFLSDKRRLNVAITRPKRLLIIIGDFDTVKQDDFLNKLGVYMDNNAYNLEVIGNIMQYDEYEDVKNKCVEEYKNMEKDDNKKNINYEEEDDDFDKGKKKGKKNFYDNNYDGNKKGKGGKKGKKKKK